MVTLLNLAWQCPYLGGDAVYAARAICTQFADSLFFDDLLLCQPDTGHSERMMRVNQPQDSSTTQTILNEFAVVYPNPAKSLINLACQVKATGTLYFGLLDELGRPLLNSNLSSTQTSAQYSTENLSSGLYYWRLKDSARTIKTGKVVIIK